MQCESCDCEWKKYKRNIDLKAFAICVFGLPIMITVCTVFVIWVDSVCK